MEIKRKEVHDGDKRVTSLHRRPFPVHIPHTPIRSTWEGWALEGSMKQVLFRIVRHLRHAMTPSATSKMLQAGS